MFWEEWEDLSLSLSKTLLVCCSGVAMKADWLQSLYNYNNHLMASFPGNLGKPVPDNCTSK